MASRQYTGQTVDLGDYQKCLDNAAGLWVKLGFSTVSTVILQIGRSWNIEALTEQLGYSH